MANSSKPTVLIVDDEPEQQRPFLLLLGESVEVQAIHPDEITEEQLISSDLILVDFVLESWPGRETAPSIGLQPLDGRSLAAVLRSHIERRKKAPPTAFALYTARLQDLSGSFPPAWQEHVIAHGNNLEWAFSKVSSDSGFPLHKQITSLASAVRLLPAVWPADDIAETKRQVNHLLALENDIPWIVGAWEDIEACHPPLHEMSERSHGLAFVRWLLHRILPYPCFLYDTQYLAARLRVPSNLLRSALQQPGPLQEALDSSLYKGMLDDFLGARWWRAGIETYIWEATNGYPFDLTRLYSIVGTFIGQEFSQAVAEPVVCVDENFHELDAFTPLTDAVRIQPDDWPPYADQAWTSRILAKEYPRLNAIVIEQDRRRLEEEHRNSPKLGNK